MISSFIAWLAAAQNVGSAISLSADSLNITETAIGTTNTGTITITNIGAEALTVSNLAISGTNAAEFSVSGCSSALAVGASCTLTITFAPSAAGSKTATLSITHNASETPATISLSSTALAAAISLSTSSLSVTSAKVGETKTDTIIITNTGTAPLTISNLAISGADAADFSVSGCSSAVAAGATCTLTVTFAPSAAGNKNATLTITSNARNVANGISTISLTSSATNPAITLSANTLTLSSVYPGQTSTGMVTVNSTGTSALTISNVSVTGTNAADFTVSTGCVGAIAANGNCAISVTFDPIGTGDKDWANTSLLMHMDGANNSTAFTDSTNKNTFTVYGNTKISTAQSKFNGASAFFDGTGDYITLPSSNNFAFGTSDYTIEFWFKPSASSIGFSTGIVQLSSDSNYFASPTASISFSLYQGTAYAAFGTTARQRSKLINDTNWHHAAMVRRLGVCSLYVDGQLTADGTVADTTNYVHSYLLIGGYAATNQTWNGYIDELRITKGVARYTANFTPTTEAFSSSAFTTAYGSRAANLVITHDALNSPSLVSLSSTVIEAAPAISLSTNALSIATTNTGSTNTGTVTVTNTGTTPLTISNLAISGTNAAEFSVSGCSNAVAAGATCTLTVTFSPSTTGSKLATLSITHDAAGSPSTVSLSSTAVAPAISLTTSALAVTSSNVGSSTTGTITVTNTGTANLTVSNLAISGANSTEFSVSGCLTPVAPNTNCVLTVTFTPSSYGSKTANLSITHNATGSPSTVSLSSTGLAPALSLSANTLAISSANVGSSATGTITVTNVGTSNLTVSNLAIAGTNASEFSISGCSTPVEPNANCVLTVTFTPSSFGSKTANLSITHNATGSPRTVGLSSTGLAPAISLSANTLAVSSTTVGYTNTGTITITNNGNSPLTVSNLAISGADAADFSVSGCSSAVAAGATCTLTVTFAPSAAGNKNATLAITHNASESPSTVSLSSTALAAVPEISLSSNVIAFSSTGIGTTANTVITVNNTGTANLVVSSLTLSGANTENFSASGCTSPIVPGGSCFVTVTFTPTTSDNVSATLSVAHNATGSPSTISLTGSGIFNTDPYFSSTSLLLHMDGANGSSDFIDATGKNTITRNTGVQVSTADSKFGGASGLFNGGTAAYLTAPQNTAAFAFGTGDFTIECWFKVSSSATNKGIFQLSSNTGYLTSGSGGITLTTFQGKVSLNLGATFAQPNITVTDGSWYHIAIVRNSGVSKIYLNGQLRTDVGTAGSITDTTNYSYSYLAIGAYGSTTQTWNGHIDEFRITKGVARYTANFTPATEAFKNAESTTNADPYFSNVSLLMHADGTNNSTSFVDSSAAVRTVTAVGNAQLSTSVKKYGTASAYFDGDGDTLTVPTSTDFAFGTGDFTIECWLYSLDAGNSARGIFDTRSSATSSAGIMIRENGNGFLIFTGAGASGATLLSTSTGRTANTWQHLAVVRSGGTLTLYVDGASLASAADATNYTVGNCRISGFTNTQASPNAYFGYIDDFRVTKGLARYNTAFTVPALAYSNSSSIMLSVPSATSVYFDGTGDYLSTSAKPAFDFGTGDFTVEGWVFLLSRPTSGQHRAIYGQWPNSGAEGYLTGQILITVNSTGLLTVFVATDGSTSTSIASTGTTVALNAWTHIAITRASGLTRIFINGKLITTSSIWSTTPIGSSVAAVNIGRQESLNTFFWQGYIADLCVSKGIAQYTAAFNPPTQAQTTNANTSLLLQASSSAITDGAGNNTISASGDAKPTPQVPGLG